MKHIAYLTGLSLIVLLNACSSGDEPVVKETTPVETEKPVATQKVNRETYSIELPAGLSEAKELNPEASLAYKSAADDRFVLIIDEPREDVYKRMKADGEYRDDLSFIENFSRKRIEMFMEGISLNYPAVRGSINSRSGQLITYQAEGKRSDVPFDITTYFAFAAGKTHCYAIMAWTVKDVKKSYENSVDELFKSFDIKN